MDAPNLVALVAHYQEQLRLRDWRIEASYEPDLKNASGQPCWGVCYPLVDAKQARIVIRDPSTPPDGVTPEQALAQVTETVVHELVHLHFAAFGNRTPAAIAAEEQAVWALAEALVAAKGTPAEGSIARAMVAQIESVNPGAERSAAAEGNVDEKNLKAAIEAIKNNDGDSALAILEAMLVGEASGGAPPGDAPSPPEAAAAPPGEEQKQPEMMAVARVAMSLTGKASAGEAMVELTRMREVVLDVERREKALAKDRAVLEANERQALVVKMVTAGKEPPATAWAKDGDGVPDGKTPAEPWASMPIAALRARVAGLGAGGAPPPKPPPNGGPGAQGLTEREVALCREKKIDPAKYADMRNRIAARRPQAQQRS